MMRWKHLSWPQYTLESEHTQWLQWTEIRGGTIHGKTTSAGNPRSRFRLTLTRKYTRIVRAIRDPALSAKALSWPPR
ncbi:MAG: hypothetical protein ACYCO5_10870 [Acidobacteriaceae bacterium]